MKNTLKMDDAFMPIMGKHTIYPGKVWSGIAKTFIQ